MKSKLILLIFIIAVNNCINDNPTNIDPTSYGSVKIKIDKINTPDDVVEVIATLSREGFDSLIASMNLLDSTSAELLFEDITAGPWLLQVEALNDTGGILYTGETIVEVLAGQISTVYLTLVPTSVGTGDIYIYVTWGNLNFSGWIDFPGNPVLEKIGNQYDPLGVIRPYVLKDEDDFKMWYEGYQGSMTHTFLATSLDGLTWTHYSNDPVLYPGQPGEWDAGRAGAGPVIKEDSLYKMYYHSFVSQYDPWQIGLAYSSDGINWQKHPTPLLTGDNWGDRVIARSVLKVDSLYYLFYSGYTSGPDGRMGLATSLDGVNWIKYDGNPILEPTENWEDNQTCYGSVIYEGNMFKMVYLGGNVGQEGFGMAFSLDGKVWIKSVLNPFFSHYNTVVNWDRIQYPSWTHIEDECRIYYNGTYLNPTECKICVARKFND